MPTPSQAAAPGRAVVDTLSERQALPAPHFRRHSLTSNLFVLAQTLIQGESDHLGVQ
jgi:hypothetical protein